MNGLDEIEFSDGELDGQDEPDPSDELAIEGGDWDLRKGRWQGGRKQFFLPISSSSSPVLSPSISFFVFLFFFLSPPIFSLPPSHGSGSSARAASAAGQAAAAQAVAGHDPALHDAGGDAAGGQGSCGSPLSCLSPPLYSSPFGHI